MSITYVDAIVCGFIWLNEYTLQKGGYNWSGDQPPWQIDFTARNLGNASLD